MWCRKGDALSTAANYEQAIIWFDAALKIDPNSLDALCGKGNALRMRGQYDEANSCFLIKLWPLIQNMPSSLAYKGEILRMKKQA